MAVVQGTTMWDVIVIGAGIEGSATAYSLAKRGRRVLQLEQFSLPHARGSSSGQSRITRLAYEEEHFTRMMPEAFKLWDELASAADVKLYIKTGLLALNKNLKELNAIENSMKAIGASYERLSGSGLRQRFPAMSFDDSISAVYDPAGGILRADRCLAAFQSQFRKYGGTLIDGEPAIEIAPEGELHGISQSVVVRTSKSSYQGHSVVIAAGAWASKLLSPLGLQLPLQPKRVVVWYWKRQGNHSYGCIEEGSPVFIKGDGHHEVWGLPSCEYPGLVKVAYHGGPDCNPDVRDATAEDHSFVKFPQEFIRHHLPGIETKPSIAEPCMYTVTPDNGFILDHHPQWRNIVIGAGFSGHGFKLAPVVGRILADLAIDGQHTTYNMDHFRMARFAKTASKL